MEYHWKTPAVDPSIFTAQEFESVIKRVGNGLNWVWIGITCIDQDNPIVGDDEIERQAGIFGNADDASTWLHRSPTIRLQCSAGYRKTPREDDRIYGIMQFFGFKLGKSV